MHHCQERVSNEASDKEQVNIMQTSHLQAPVIMTMSAMAAINQMNQKSILQTAIRSSYLQKGTKKSDKDSIIRVNAGSLCATRSPPTHAVTV